MSEKPDIDLDKATRWDKKFAADDPEKWRRPSRLLVDNIPLVGGIAVDGGKGRALDVASGPGRNSVYLAEHGFVVDAVDNSKTGLEMARSFALERGEEVAGNLNLIEADLDDFVIEPGAYDLIINFYYLNRGLISEMAAGLKAGGYLIFETFTKEHDGFNEGSNPSHYLNPNELLGLVLSVSGEKRFHILYYREGAHFEEGLMRSAAQLVARKI
ncbi:MAG: class I SAM-dependent methyltransferase [Deltaproteobacteria bacterium]